jgi:raffinose/stachyose/melibiose transport system substrate-binding protein
MKLKSVLAAATAAGLAATLAACSPGSGDGEATSITVWHNSATKPAVMSLFERFTEETGIEIELVAIPADAFQSTITTKWGTGDRPDILEYHPDFQPMLALNPAETLQDLSDMEFVSKAGSLYETSGQYDGKVYAAITGFPSIFAIYYNKAVFAEAGLEPPQNFDDLFEACDAIAGTGVAPIYESGASLWPTQLLVSQYLVDYDMGSEYGDKVATNQVKLTEPDGPFLKALHAYVDLRDQGCFNKDYSTGTFEDAMQAVVDGTAAMTALHSDVYAQLVAAIGGDEQKLSDTIGFVTVSANTPAGLYIPGPLGTFFAPKTGDSAREAAARQFIEFATGEGYADFLKETNGVPMLEGYPQPTGRTELQESFEAGFQGAQTALLSRLPGFGSFPVEMGKLLNGQQTPEETAANMQVAVEQASKAAGQPGW